MSKQNLQQLLDEANDRIAELEEELEMLYTFSESEKIMLEVIKREIGRLNNDSKSYKLDKDDIKAFDTLVKDFVAIRGKMPTPKTPEIEESENDIRENLSILYGDK